MRKTLVGAVLLATLFAGCSDDASSSAVSKSSDESLASTDSSANDETSPSTDSSANAAPSVAGEALPDTLIGTFQRGPGEFFAFYESGDEVCADAVGTDQHCYAVGSSRNASAEPIELGVAAVEGDVLRWVPTQDPLGSCVGATNMARWSATAEGVTLTPTKDCHGLEPINLVRVS
jgi:hypothetical protein